MPKGAPTDVVAKLSAAVQTMMADPNFRARIAALGQETFGTSKRQMGLQRSKRARSSDGGQLSKRPTSNTHRMTRKS